MVETFGEQYATSQAKKSVWECEFRILLRQTHVVAPAASNEISNLTGVPGEVVRVPGQICPGTRTNLSGYLDKSPPVQGFRYFQIFLDNLDEIQRKIRHNLDEIQMKFSQNLDKIEMNFRKEFRQNFRKFQRSVIIFR